MQVIIYIYIHDIVHDFLIKVQIPVKPIGYIIYYTYGKS